MACRLDGAKPFQCWNIVNSTLRNKLQWNFNRNSNIFIQENVLENVVWEMAAILPRPQCVKQPPHPPATVWWGQRVKLGQEAKTFISWHRSHSLFGVLNCMMAPSYYLNQCWLMISKVLCYSPEMLKISVIRICCTITHLRWLPSLSVDNELSDIKHCSELSISKPFLFQPQRLMENYQVPGSFHKRQPKSLQMVGTICMDIRRDLCNYSNHNCKADDHLSSWVGILVAYTIDIIVKNCICFFCLTFSEL